MIKFHGKTVVKIAGGFVVLILLATIFLHGSQSKTGNLPEVQPPTSTVAQSTPPDDSPSLLTKILLNNKILRGTKWCGHRNIASSRDDLGFFSKTDACCRDHDLCPDNLHGGKSKHGLTNTDSYTASHCDCDEKFFRCLKDIGSVTSYIVGFGFFTVMGQRCYRKDYPIVECQQYKYNYYSVKDRSNRRCVEYRLDQTAEKVYQWFDNPLF